jgi:hypothetical protein
MSRKRCRLRWSMQHHLIDLRFKDGVASTYRMHPTYQELAAWSDDKF